MEQGKHLTAFIMPTHGFTAPWPMIRFALHLPPGKGTHALVATTRAGLKFGPVYTPGMEGTAGYLIALILLLKGYGIRGVIGIDMPSNWLSLHPGLKPESAAGIIERAKKKSVKFMEKIVTGRRCFPLSSIIQLFFGLLLLPVSMGYLLVGRFFLAKLFFANPKCNGCGICADNCPNRAIRMWGVKNPRPYWTFSCESCMRCMGYCPQKAIEAGHSLGLLLYFITTIPVGVIFMNMLNRLLPSATDLSQSKLNWLIQYPYILLSIYLSYLLVSLLIRIPIINRAFTWTTFTRFWRRYHEPETRLRDIQVRDSR
jgi:ferredoxin